jgi:thiamine-monophosphate kinase
MSPHEFDLVQWISSRTGVSTGTKKQIGIGDDAAVWSFDSDSLVLATDMLMEGVHFDLLQASPEQVGRKALAVNLSDLAAMAAIPQAALVSLALPRKQGIDFAMRMMSGLLELAEQFEVSLIGGDTNLWEGPLVINVAVAGTPGPRGPISRGGAKPGDQIFVTGPLGGSREGRHLDFVPRVREALALSELVRLHAMIDLSDGLVADLRHLLDASNVGCRLFANRIPVSPGVIFSLTEVSSLDRALGDGEDFELLFAVSNRDAAALARQTQVHCHHVGEIVNDPSKRVLVRYDGTEHPLPDVGWTHRFAE